MSKKLLLAITFMLMLTLTAATFVGCTGGEGGEPGSEENIKYKVTVNASDDYILTTSLTSGEAKAGDKVTVQAKSKNSDKYIIGVQYNSKDCDLTDSGEYKFTMPAENVTLTALMEDYEEVLSDGIATFDRSNYTEIEKTEESDVATLLINFNASYMTILESDIASSDENVIPTSAIELEEITSMDIIGSSGGNDIVQAKIHIDRSQINLGTTWLTMFFQSGNSLSEKGTLRVKITVSESVTIERWTETLVFDVSDIDKEGQTYYVAIGINGKNEHQEFKDLKAVDGKVTVTISYAVNQKYYIAFAILHEDGRLEEYKLTNSISGGSTATGVNQYKDGKLSFVEEGVTLKITVLK